MKILTSRMVWGLLLVAGGILFLLENLNILEIADFFWAVLFAIGSVSFFSVYFTNRLHWWALIPATILADLALVVVLGLFGGALGDTWSGPIFLAGLAVAFFLVYLASPANWWAVIPGGVMVTLAAVSALDEITSMETGGVFFMGLGLTFALLGVLPGKDRQMRWAFIPALALFAMGVVVTTASSNLINYIWPAALILAGLYLLTRPLLSRRGL